MEDIEKINEKIFEKVKAGDKLAQTLFYENNKKYLTSYLLKYNKDLDLIEECIQETMITFFKNIDNFEYSETKITVYLISMLKKRLIDRFRKKNDEIYEEDLLKYDNGYEQLNTFDYEINSILSEINKFESVDRDIVLDFFIKDIKIVEIAKKRDMNINTIKTKIRRARVLLKEKFKNIY